MCQSFLKKKNADALKFSVQCNDIYAVCLKCPNTFWSHCICLWV